MKYQKEVFRSMAMVMQFGINMLVPILLCTFLGIFFDKLLGTSFIVIIMFFIGAAAGFRNIYIFASRTSAKNNPIGSDAAKRLDDNSKEIVDKEEISATTKDIISRK